MRTVLRMLIFVLKYKLRVQITPPLGAMPFTWFRVTQFIVVVFSLGRVGEPKLL